MHRINIRYISKYWYIYPIYQKYPIFLIFSKISQYFPSLRVWVYAVLPSSSQLIGPTCVQGQSSNPRGRACGPSGKGSGRRGYWVTLYLYIYTARFLVSVFLWVSNPGMHAGRPPQPLSTPCTVGPGRTSAAHVDGPIGSIPTCSLLLSLTRQWLITERHLTPC